MGGYSAGGCVYLCVDNVDAWWNAKVVRAELAVDAAANAGVDDASSAVAKLGLGGGATGVVESAPPVDLA